MAEETEVDTLSRMEVDSSDSGDSSGGEEEQQQVEWLVHGRAKRSTAGNRLGSLLQQAVAEDDDLELLFAEDEDDAGFEVEDENQSDVQMDSSSDEEDQGPTAGADDLEGEKELEQEAREKRKKRKLNDAIPKKFRQKVRIDPTVPRPAPRPKKKSERGSWIPTPEDAPTRASSRQTTKQSKEQLHAQMLDREARRLRLLEKMEKAAQRKEAAKPKALTQAERLAEAARVEKKNAKSLNRWEEAEKQREEEQRAKLEALKNRKLEGPVITWWSGKTEWWDGKLRKVGSLVIEEKESKPKKRKLIEVENEKIEAPSKEESNGLSHPSSKEADNQAKSNGAPTDPGATGTAHAGETGSTKATTPGPKDVRSTPDSKSLDGTTLANAEQGQSEEKPTVPSSQNGIASSGAQQEEQTEGVANKELKNGAEATPSAPTDAELSPTKSSELSKSATDQNEGLAGDLPKPFELTDNQPAINPQVADEASKPTLPLAEKGSEVDEDVTMADADAVTIEVSAKTQATDAAPEVEVQKQDGDGNSQKEALNGSNTQEGPATDNPEEVYIEAKPTEAPDAVPSKAEETEKSPDEEETVKEPEPPSVIEYSMRNSLILQNFNEEAIKSKDVQAHLIFGRKIPKAQKPPQTELCVITALPAKYRDPSTGLPYLNAFAYKEIQRAKKSQYLWSTLTSSYLGPNTFSARGVPDRFLTGKKSEHPPVAPPMHTVQPVGAPVMTPKPVPPPPRHHTIIHTPSQPMTPQFAAQRYAARQAPPSSVPPRAPMPSPAPSQFRPHPPPPPGMLSAAHVPPPPGQIPPRPYGPLPTMPQGSHHTSQFMSSKPHVPQHTPLKPLTPHQQVAPKPLTPHQQVAPKPPTPLQQQPLSKPSTPQQIYQRPPPPSPSPSQVSQLSQLSQTPQLSPSTTPAPTGTPNPPPASASEKK